MPAGVPRFWFRPPPSPAKIIQAWNFGGLTSGIKQVVLYLLWIGGHRRRDRWGRCCCGRRLCRRRRSGPSQHPARWAVFRFCDGGIVVALISAPTPLTWSVRSQIAKGQGWPKSSMPPIQWGLCNCHNHPLMYPGGNHHNHNGS